MLEFLTNLFGNIGGIFDGDGWKMVIMWVIGAILIYLAIAKDMEPGLMLPLGFGAILVNLPTSGAFSPINDALTSETGVLTILYKIGIENEVFPLLLFIGIGAMIDFGPLLSNPKLMIFGAASQFGIFITFIIAALAGFGVRDAASISIIGAADGPTSIAVAQHFKVDTGLLGAIIVAAYSYMALVPIIQPPVIKLLTTKKERLIRMPYREKDVSKLTRILFPIIITVIAGLISPKSVALVGFLMFGNLLRECGVLNSLSQSAQSELANLITILLGIAIAPSLYYKDFIAPQTLMVLGLGLIAFIFDTAGGVLLAKLFNVFLPEGKKINPMIGGTGISAFPMSARVVHKMGLKEDPQNFLLMHTIGVNVSGQISSVIAGGLVLTLVPKIWPAVGQALGF